jgi:2-keto-4-pentenoate hydratase
MILEKDGQIAGTAAGAAAPGHPAYAAAWLVDKLADFGLGLKAASSCCRAH